ncbi:MAG: nucleotidyltransferase domain-containing protein [Patescibacteria group bacterium]
MEADRDVLKLGGLIKEVDQRIRKVLLFGSAARGESGLTSDVDLCIVVPDSTKTGVAELIRQKVLSKLQAEGVKTGEVPGGVNLEVISEGELLIGERRGKLYGNIQRDSKEL